MNEITLLHVGYLFSSKWSPHLKRKQEYPNSIGCSTPEGTAMGQSVAGWSLHMFARIWDKSNVWEVKLDYGYGIPQFWRSYYMKSKQIQTPKIPWIRYRALRQMNNTISFFLGVSRSQVRPSTQNIDHKIQKNRKVATTQLSSTCCTLPPLSWHHRSGFPFDPPDERTLDHVCKMGRGGVLQRGSWAENFQTVGSTKTRGEHGILNISHTPCKTERWSDK